MLPYVMLHTSKFVPIYLFCCFLPFTCYFRLNTQNPKSTETLVSLIIVTQLLGKTEDNSRFTSQLRSISPSHPQLSRAAELSDSFDAAAAQFA